MLTRKSLLLGIAGSAGLLMMGSRGANAAQASSASPFPLQLDARVLFEPTVFPSIGGDFIVYELHLTNFSGSPVIVQRIEIMDDASGNAVAILEGEGLDKTLQPIGSPPKDLSSSREIASGRTSIAYMWLQIGNGANIPFRLRHRVVTTDNAVEGEVIRTRAAELLTLARPVRGAGWMASNGPGNGRGNHHRRGLLILDGNPVISRRLAVDWFLQKEGKILSGNVNNTRSYFTYGQPVFSVADAVVVSMRDGQPDNIPGPVEQFRTALPVTMDTVAGNHIVLDLGGGQYAWYCHLQPGSLRIKAGDRVSRGQLLGQIGCSGDANLPHLHFEVTTSEKLLAGEGVPYLIDRYGVWTDGAIWQTRTNELPLDRMLIDFGV